MEKLKTLRFGILGFGNLGSLITRRLIGIGVPAANIFAVARSSNRHVIQELGVISVDDRKFPKVDLLICATKPAQFEDAWQTLAFPEGGPTLFVSFMARGSLKDLMCIIGSEQIVRAMTSTPCVIGKGVGAWMGTPALDAASREIVKAFFAALGVHIEAQREEEIAFATVLSSMNGIVFELLYGLEKAMNYIGAPRRYQALVVAVLESALAYRRFRDSAHPSSLVDEVASPAGTTVQMRYVFDRAGIPAVFADMARAAYEKIRG